MTLVNTNARKSLVCVGYKHQFDLIDEDGEVSRIHTLDRQKVSFVSFEIVFMTIQHNLPEQYYIPYNLKQIGESSQIDNNILTHIYFIYLFFLNNILTHIYALV